MFTGNNPEDELQKQGNGGVIAGSGGAANAQGGQQPAGSGFTNLQTYLSANQGQGRGIAQNIVSEGQKGVDTARNDADMKADRWAAIGVQEANQAGQDASTNMTAYGGPKSAQDVSGYNQLESNYQNVKKTADNFANDYDTQKAGLRNKYGYGGGFGALDTFLGRQDGKDTIQGWQNGVQTGSADKQVGQVNQAIAGGQKAASDAQAAQAAQVAAAQAAATAKAEKDAQAAETKAVKPTGWGTSGIAGGMILDPVPSAQPLAVPKANPLGSVVDRFTGGITDPLGTAKDDSEAIFNKLNPFGR